MLCKLVTIENLYFLPSNFFLRCKNARILVYFKISNTKLIFWIITNLETFPARFIVFLFLKDFAILQKQESNCSESELPVRGFLRHNAVLPLQCYYDESRMSNAREGT